ncbi:DUF393 domain-containing protein [bacterium]|nr:DUF393 domain-containing protein [bacterium]
MPATDGPVLLYDGECGFCRAWVRQLVRVDGRGMLRFAPLQGAFAQVALRRCGLPLKDFESLVFLPEAEGEKYHLRTEGLIAALARLGGGWRVAARFIAVVPATWRNAVYNGVAGARYRIFGRVVYRDGELLDPKWAQRFLT